MHTSPLLTFHCIHHLLLLSLLFSLPAAALPSNDVSPFLRALPPFDVTADPDSSLTTSNDSLASSPTSPKPDVEVPLASLFLLEQRAAAAPTDPCQAGYNSCSTLAAQYAGVCCATSAICSLDSAGNAACCPLGSVCTGTINPNTANSATSTTTSATATTTSAGSPATTATGEGTASASFVPNSFFPFPYLAAATLTDAAACAAARSTCAADYDTCTTDLQGGAFGVTIQAPAGAGVTVAAPSTALNLGPASATSICSSLSSVACAGLQGSPCASGGASSVAQTGATTATGFVVATAASAARRGVRGCEAAPAGLPWLLGSGLGVVVSAWAF
ncbi:MAG: hypothetical protein M1818_007515 [Claussenomyces sp. TS43310]|nr:MAG: hypothetical protein M1818_007515 [Claussenomyces sp. TS43310]